MQTNFLNMILNVIMIKIVFHPEMIILGVKKECLMINK